MSGIKFEPGRIVATPGALEAFRASGVEPLALLQRHLGGDWGDLSEADKAENELSLRQGFRILSAYKLKNGLVIWVITEAERSATTFLPPDEY